MLALLHAAWTNKLYENTGVSLASPTYSLQAYAGQVSCLVCPVLQAQCVLSLHSLPWNPNMNSSQCLEPLETE